MMMYFEFNEHKLKQNNLTQEQCFRVIDKVMNEYGVHANQPGTWFLKVIEKWFWFDDEDDIDWNDKRADCLYSIYMYGS